MQKNPHSRREPIGVFDSGIGGLTVLRALQDKYPHESYVYLGDTARLPYGTKSPETIVRYAQSMTKEILKHQVKAIVIACNTASTHALSAVQAMAEGIPVLGMIAPAAQAALAATRNRHIGVIATYGTIKSGAYEKEMNRIDPNVRVSSRAAQLLVALAEEGWADTDIATRTLHEYLDAMFDVSDAPDTLILGCTHFPLFEKQLAKILGENVTLINSGAAAASCLSVEESDGGGVRFLATDDPSRFAANAAKFFGRDVAADEVGLIDI